MRSLLLTFIILAGPWPTLAETKPTLLVKYPKTADYLIAELAGKGGYQSVTMEDFLAGKVRDCPDVQVFGDGRVVVCNDDKMLEIQLSEAELDAFIQSLLGLGVHDLDSDGVAREKLADDEDRFRQTGAVVISVDVPTYELVFQLSGYAPAGEQALRPVETRLKWHSVAMSAEHYPNNKEVQRLAAVERLFGNLSHRAHQVNHQRRQPFSFGRNQNNQVQHR